MVTKFIKIYDTFICIKIYVFFLKKERCKLTWILNKNNANQLRICYFSNILYSLGHIIYNFQH